MAANHWRTATIIFALLGNCFAKVTFWQITDIHFDAFYSEEAGDPDNWCHHHNSSSSSKAVGAYGDYSCDSPWTLAKSALQAMREIQPNPDFILWTGDSSPHWQYPSMEYVFSAERALVALIRTHFPNTKVVPVMGNHDTSPPDFFPGKVDVCIIRILAE